MQVSASLWGGNLPGAQEFTARVQNKRIDMFSEIYDSQWLGNQVLRLPSEIC
jgi:hypothetical protein